MNQATSQTSRKPTALMLTTYDRISRKQRPIICSCEHALHLDLDGGYHPVGARVVFVVKSWDGSGRLPCAICDRSHASRGVTA